MAVGTDPEFFNFSVSSSQTPSLNTFTDIPRSAERACILSGRIRKRTRNSTLTFFNKSLIARLRQPEFVRKHSVLRKQIRESDSETMRNSDVSDSMENVYLERKLRDYTNHGFDHTLLVEEDMLSSEVDSLEKPNSRYNSPIDEVSSRSSKSPNSIEDLNKEIERLFLNNEKFGFTSFIFDAEDIAEGRRAPIADMLHCCKNLRNRRKKRRIATALAIRNYNESDSSNGISSPDDNSGCEEYTESTLIENLDPPIIVPVAGKSGIDQLQALNISGPFSGNKLQLSESSAFAPIRSQSTPPQSTNIIDVIGNENKIF